MNFVALFPLPCCSCVRCEGLLEWAHTIAPSRELSEELQSVPVALQNSFTLDTDSIYPAFLHTLKCVGEFLLKLCLLFTGFMCTWQQSSLGTVIDAVSSWRSSSNPALPAGDWALTARVLSYVRQGPVLCQRLGFFWLFFFLAVGLQNRAFARLCFSFAKGKYSLPPPCDGEPEWDGLTGFIIASSHLEGNK